MNAIKISGADVQAQLSVFVYQDNDYPGGVYIAYCPELDLAGCDDTEEGARKSFEIVMNDYFEDTIAKGTLEKDLLVHGWRRKNGKNTQRPGGLAGSKPRTKRQAPDALYDPETGRYLNEETMKAIREAEAGIGLEEYETIEDFKKMVEAV